MNFLFSNVDSTDIYEIRFENNELTYLNKSWLRYVNLKSAYFKSNKIKELNQYLFWHEYFTNLDLSYNLIDNINNVLNSDYISYRLSRVNLAGNLISTLNDLKYSPSNLDYLDLSNNLLRTFDKIVGDKLKLFSSKLQFLILDNNMISSIFDGVSFEFLQELRISGNLFTQVTKITFLNYLNVLDLSNQKNNSLKTIQNYAFERQNTNNNFILGFTINIDSNNIEEFGSKTFCSRYQNDKIVVTKIVLTYSSMKNMNPCLLTQMKNVYFQPKPIKIIINDPKLDDSALADSLLYPDVCNCKMIQFADEFFMELLGVCSNFDIKKCQNSNNAQLEIDICLSRPEFLCDNTITVQVTSTKTGNNLLVSTAGNGLSTNNAKKTSLNKAQIKLFLISILICFFLI